MRFSGRIASALALLLVIAAVDGAALAQSGQAMQTTLARQALRIDQLETEIRRLTGHNEGLAHRIDQLERRLKSLQGRLSEMEKRPAATTPEAPVAEAPPATAPAGNSSVPEPAKSAAADAIPGAEKGAKPLGMLKSGEDTKTAAVPPKTELSPEQLYEKAQNLIVKDQNFAEAQTLLTQFIDKNPKHDLTPNAYYWLGRTHFVRSDFKNAAYAFAEGFQKFPKSDKAPANLLNLGMALAGLGKKKEACTTWAQLSKSYPKAPASVKRRVSREQRRSKCR